MPQNPVRNRVMAGAFLLLMLAAALAILVLVGNWRLRAVPMQMLRIHFAAAPNIKTDSSVLLAGHPVGSVAQIGLVEVPCKEGDKRQKMYKVEVDVLIPRIYRICQNARITIQQALIGQSAVLNIEDVGYGDAAAGPIEGEQASPFAGAAEGLGIGPQEQKNFATILANVTDITTRTKDDWPKILADLKATSANLADVSAGAKDTLKRVNAVLDDNRDNLRATIANAKSVSERADKGAAEVLAELKGFAEKLKDIADKNGEDIRVTIARARSFMEKTDKDADEVRAKIKTTADNIKTASENLKEVMEKVKGVAADTEALVATNKGNLDTTLQNFRETSDHLLALAKEVRRAPWRLFATPDKQEVESLNLYDSAIAFSSAAGELESAAAKVQIMLAAKQRNVGVDPVLLRTMVKHLEATFENYQKAEDALLKEFDRVRK